MQRSESQESLEVNFGDTKYLTLHLTLLTFRLNKQPTFDDLIKFFKRYEVLYQHDNDHGRLTSLMQYLHEDLCSLLTNFQLIHTDTDRLLYHKLKTFLLFRPIAQPILQAVQPIPIQDSETTNTPQYKRPRVELAENFSDFDETESSCSSSSSEDESVGSIADFVVSDSSSQISDDDYIPPHISDDSGTSDESSLSCD